MLVNRARDILLATIEDYIHNGEPISSKSLYEDYEFGIRPASIRAELNDLEIGGWLSQSHPSGGRIPTDKAFEFFAETAKKDALAKKNPTKKYLDIAALVLGGELKDFVSRFSDEAHLLSVGFAVDENETYKSGLDELFYGIETVPSNVFYEIARDVENLDNRISQLLEEDNIMRNGPTVYIGKKSPLIQSDYVTTVFDIFNVDGEEVFLAAFGPKRMNYKKSFNAFLNLRRALENNT